MPKKKIHVKGSANPNKNIQRKFRIGNRKNGVSAITMKTVDLVKILSDKDKSKWHHLAVQVLKIRGNIPQVV